MPSYGPWTTYTGIRESVGRAIPVPDRPEWVPAAYRTSPVGPYAVAGTYQYSMSESFDSFIVGAYPAGDTGARLCALAHAKERDQFSSFLSWDPGECLTVVPGTPTFSTPGRPAGDLDGAATVGTSASWSPPPLPILPTAYHVSVLFAQFGLAWNPLWYRLGVPAEVGEETSFAVWQQIPGWEDAMRVNLPPQLEVLNLTGEASISMSGSQPAMANPVSVSGHVTGSLVELNMPYSGFGASQMSCSAGGSSSTVTFPGMTFGEYHAWHLASSRVLAGSDPGATQDNLADVTTHVDFVWDVRVRFQIPAVIDVCRWLNRDDGLGVTGAARARTGTSLQRGNRHRGYR